MPFSFGTIWATGVPGTAANMVKDLCGHGLFSEFPSPAPYVSVNNTGNVGMIAHATDRNMLYRSNGSSWVSIGIALPPGSESGDILYFNGTAIQRLAKGADGTYLTLTSGLPSWATPPSQFSTQTDVTASRALGTTYRNTTGKPMIVQVILTMGLDPYESGGVHFRTDSATPPTFITAVVQEVSQGIYCYFTDTITTLVLPNNYYRLLDFGTYTGLTLKWTEVY